MKSKASIGSHPIHAMLVSFPVAFFTGTLLFDILAQVYFNSGFWRTAYYLQIAGVLSALVAAIPGVVDYLYTVPPKSTAKKRAARHGLLNIGHVAIFFTAWMLKRLGGTSDILILLLEAAGLGIMSYAAWMGGTLVYRNQIGVDPRYAGAGKWKEAYPDAAQDPIEVGSETELKPNQMKLLHIRDKRIVLARTESGYVAFDDRCTHRGGSLAGGAMICGTVQCPWHGSQFDVTTGEVKCGPAKEKIMIYRLSSSDGKVFLHIK